ncbi:hypothetical protein [Paenibacillus sp. N3.4]|uniref:hypothetical protein n=1 Tax=Paenibacillus sp. N3.4 TaxID=2603222 RepID=UPI0011CCD29C|nr:hypothetical protein [Paenibacillus sp. N3.4]TXK85908.1 hypothetical protein FU659_00075 [Paenibacillus sp. N3.4]
MDHGEARSYEVKGLDKVVDFSFDKKGVALREDGTVWEWSYQYGSPEDTTWYFPVSAPVQKQQLKDIVKVALGHYNIKAALDKDGIVWVWTTYIDPFVTNKDKELDPVAIPGLKK